MTEYKAIGCNSQSDNFKSHLMIDNLKITALNCFYISRLCNRIYVVIVRLFNFLLKYIKYNVFSASIYMCWNHKACTQHITLKVLHRIVL